MSVKAKRALIKKFKIGARLIEFPLPSANLEDNVKHLMPNFPILRMTTVLETDAEVMADGQVIYNVVCPVKTNG